MEIIMYVFYFFSFYFQLFQKSHYLIYHFDENRFQFYKIQQITNEQGTS